MTEKQSYYDSETILVRVRYRIQWAKGSTQGRVDAIEAALECPDELVGSGPNGSYRVERLPGAEVIQA
jgi:hypothetical protein